MREGLLRIEEVEHWRGGAVEEDFEGKLLMFEEPLIRGEEYFMGVDVGSGKGSPYKTSTPPARPDPPSEDPANRSSR